MEALGLIHWAEAAILSIIFLGNNSISAGFPKAEGEVVQQLLTARVKPRLTVSRSRGKLPRSYVEIRRGLAIKTNQFPANLTRFKGSGEAPKILGKLPRHLVFLVS